ncbi:prolipoprotein diacylglyceryl transferase [Patescibacteria group bacterium]|nr:prolipoprotein diacylglyceryl transferase [Patescibacteria group bacterium]MBU2259768.1 prolipoprotein diacylglyceryl transferase [Patescibacteria group bacterium]
MIHFFSSRTVALELLGFSIHWYGLMYLAGFVLAFFLLPRLQKYRGLTLSKDDWAKLLSWGIIGVIAGGRLGFVLFYEPGFFLRYPSEILQVWHGGMSSHGGFVGVAIALILVSQKRKIDLLALGDCLAIPIALGLALGRLGNLINGELYGVVTSVPWAMEFPDVEGLRHPTQLYAIVKNLIIAGICLSYLKKAKPVYPGRTFALFLMLYGILRYLIEYFRDQPYGLFDFGFILLSRGQLLTVPLIIVGLILWIKFGPNKKPIKVEEQTAQMVEPFERNTESRNTFSN